MIDSGNKNCSIFIIYEIHINQSLFRFQKCTK